MKRPANKFLQKLSYGYRTTALILLNTILALLILNFILFLMFSIVDRYSQNEVSTKYGNSLVRSVYEELDQNELDELLKETWTRPYIYEPFTQFKEQPYQGDYINVDINGFRTMKNQGPWPPQPDNLVVFIFGGSTTFGYGVADDQTMAAHLQGILAERLDQKVHVYNFGRGHYYSTQERILYEQLLTSGIVPDMAIFIDGLNDFYHISNEPLFTNEFRYFVDQEPMKYDLTRMPLLSKTSIARAASVFKHRLAYYSKKAFPNKPQNEETENRINRNKYDKSEILELVLDNYFANKKVIEAVSTSFTVVPIFVWQPIPNYHYDQQYHPFSKSGYGEHSYAKYGYEQMAKLLEEDPPAENFLWCADIQKNLKEPLYIDQVHYSAHFSEKIAIEIADLIISRSLLSDAEALADTDYQIKTK